MNAPQLPTDLLFNLEYRIARRADELAQRFGVDRGHALDHWRRAEEEMWRDRRSQWDAPSETEHVIRH